MAEIGNAVVDAAAVAGVDDELVLGGVAGSVVDEVALVEVEVEKEVVKFVDREVIKEVEVESALTKAKLSSMKAERDALKQSQATLKERVADEYYDPFRWIFRKLSGR